MFRERTPTDNQNMQTENKTRKHGFTLVEIMFVMMIIGILFLIAMPNFISARERGRSTACIANLKQVDSAKSQYAIANGLNNGDPITMPLLFNGGFLQAPRITGATPQQLSNAFVCPASNLPYEPGMGSFGTTPVCPAVALRVGQYAHALP